MMNVLKGLYDDRYMNCLVCKAIFSLIRKSIIQYD